jgi:hypothetical protein
VPGILTAVAKGIPFAVPGVVDVVVVVVATCAVEPWFRSGVHVRHAAKILTDAVVFHFSPVAALLETT